MHLQMCEIFCSGIIMLIQNVLSFFQSIFKNLRHFRVKKNDLKYKHYLICFYVSLKSFSVWGVNIIQFQVIDHALWNMMHYVATLVKVTHLLN